jgi:RNA polymerase sigma-70 factor (ECF subfamily)
MEQKGPPSLKKKDFEKTYNRFFNFFYDVAVQFLHHEEDAKEVVQDAFIKLWENDIYLQTEKEIKNYLFILVRNRCLNLLRERKSKLLHVDSHDFLLASINYTLLNETGEDILLHQELFEIIQSSIARLTPQCREVFKMSRFEDLSNKEIAQKLEISVKAVEANMTRALKSLKTALAPYLHGNERNGNSPVIRSILLSFFQTLI